MSENDILFGIVQLITDFLTLFPDCPLLFVSMSIFIIFLFFEWCRVLTGGR